jgi:hypothetical protein
MRKEQMIINKRAKLVGNAKKKEMAILFTDIGGMET